MLSLIRKKNIVLYFLHGFNSVFEENEASILKLCAVTWNETHIPLINKENFGDSVIIVSVAQVFGAVSMTTLVISFVGSGSNLSISVDNFFSQK